MGAVALRKNGPFQRLVGSTAANELAQSMAMVVIPLLVLGGGHSPAMAGLVVFAYTAAAIVSQVFSGALTDRLSSSRALRLASAMQALCWAVLVVFTVFKAGTIAAMLVVCVVAGVFASVGAPSEQTLIKELVPSDQVGRAAAIGQGREAAAGLLGGPVGGAILSVSGSLALGVQTVLHVIGALLVPSARREATSDEEDQGILHGVREGFSFVAHHPGLRIITVVASLINLPISALPLTLIAYYQSRAVPDALIGLFSSAMGVGVLIGAFAAGWLTSHWKVSVLGFSSLVGFVAMFAVAAIVHPYFLWTCVAMAVAGLVLPAFNSAISAYTLAVSPEASLGSIVSATGVPGMILMPLGPLLGGISLDTVGIQVTLVVLLVLAAIPLVCAAASASFRALPTLAQLTDPLANNGETEESHA